MTFTIKINSGNNNISSSTPTFIGVENFLRARALGDWFDNFIKIKIMFNPIIMPRQVNSVIVVCIVKQVMV